MSLLTYEVYYQSDTTEGSTQKEVNCKPLKLLLYLVSLLPLIISKALNSLFTFQHPLLLEQLLTQFKILQI